MSDSRNIVRVEGTALPLRGNDIDTDRIIPARFLRAVTFDHLEDHLFEDERRQGSEAGKVHPIDNPAYQGATVLLVNRNFGCGSSREHAPQAIRRWGIQAIVGESFSDIFFNNSIALGLPCPTASPADVERLMIAVEAESNTRLVVDLAAGTVSAGTLSISIALPPAARKALVEGLWDGTGLLLDHEPDARKVAAALPYIAGF